VIVRFVILIALFCASSSGFAQSVFPMRKGTAWTYRGSVRWTIVGTSQVREKKLDWKVEVIDHASRGQSEAALLHGWPSDLAWYEESSSPGFYVLVREGSSYYLYADDAKAVFTRYTTSGSFKPDPARIFFRVPLQEGTKYCDPGDQPRTDTFYCWYVSAKQNERLRINGVPAGPLEVATLLYYTVPEHELLQLAAGVGITHFEFRHHGTVSDVDIDLIDYVAGKE
jgi:hypothetical protein